MPRISPSTNPDSTSQALLAGVKQMLGSVPNMFATLAHSSSALGFTIAGFTGFGESKVPASLREQIAIAVAGINNCDYCASAHTALGKMNKISESELAQNLEGRSSDTKTQAALAFANQVVQKHGQVSDADLSAIRSAGYGDAEIIDIVAIVTFNIFTNYLNHVVGTDVDFPLVRTTNATKAV